jgi:hypothetical protein
VESVWKSLNTDVLISTEMACWVGDRPCNSNELKKYESINSNHFASPFAGSAFMGVVRALVEILSLSHHLDDEYSFTTFIATEKLSVLNHVTIKLDFYQQIFGSTEYSQHHISSCPTVGNTPDLVSCYDIIEERFFENECCSNHNIPSFYTYLYMFEMLKSGPQVCNLIRLPTKNYFFSEAFQQLAWQ